MGYGDPVPGCHVPLPRSFVVMALPLAQGGERAQGGLVQDGERSLGMNPGVRIRGVDGGRRETVSAGLHASRAVAEQRNSARVRLGVKSAFANHRLFIGNDWESTGIGRSSWESAGALNVLWQVIPPRLGN